MKQIPLWGTDRPPQLRALTNALRQLNRILPAPTAVSLTERGSVAPSSAPVIAPLALYGRENLPGSGKPFDATASARRLLAALRDLEPA